MGSDMSVSVYSCANQTLSHLSYSVDEENTVYLLFNSSTDNYNPNPQPIRTHYEGLIGPMVLFIPVKLGRNFENALYFCMFLAKKLNVFCKSTLCDVTSNHDVTRVQLIELFIATPGVLPR